MGVYTVVEYDTETALDYAIDHSLRGCLKLNSGAFEKVAKAMNSLDFVTIGTDPRAKVSTDLSHLLG